MDIKFVDLKVVFSNHRVISMGAKGTQQTVQKPLGGNETLLIATLSA